ncbi:hypothetical protein BHE74_00028699 [Ensete ventricosum]|nr:hypothetical protein BHE74_00028699 [Ensete ventricosum]
MHLFFVFDFTFYFITMQTGSMKLGRDVLVLTQTSSSRSVALLSQSYNENKEVSYFDCSSVMVSSLSQICVPLDYSLQAYLEVIFLNPRMKIYVQGSLVIVCITWFLVFYAYLFMSYRPFMFYSARLKADHWRNA